jgi:IS605 OrfB family transposase
MHGFHSDATRCVSQGRSAFGKAFSRSLKSSSGPHLTASWAEQAKVFEGFDFNSNQESSVLRKAEGLRKAANAKASYLAGHLGDMAKSCQAKIAKKKLDLAALKAELSSLRKNPMARPEAIRKKEASAKLLRQAIDRMQERAARLASSSAKQAALAKAGKASICFGSRKLLTQRELIGLDDAAFGSVEKWRSAWTEARDLRWLFEGDKAAASANRQVKFDPAKRELSIVLSNDQAKHRARALARKDGKKLCEVMSLGKRGLAPMSCRYLAIENVSFGKQDKKFTALQAALTPQAKPEGSTTTQPCEAPVSWSIWIEGDIKKPSSCKVFARAQWEAKEAPVLSFSSNGCVGVDINAWGVSLAYCDAQGNKPARGSNLFGGEGEDCWLLDISADLAGSSNQSLHQIRHVAKLAVDEAASLGCPIAIENLDFSKKKLGLRYEDPKRAKQLSGFAYQKLIEAILARARKVGVEVRFVDPAWTSLVGWAKYGSRLGINPDQSAAFAIARRGVLSKNIHIKRAKRGKDWIDVYAKPERLEGLKSKAGVACEISQATPAATKQIKAAKAASTNPAMRGRRQSTQPSSEPAERLLSRSLGSRRAAWPGNLALAAGASRRNGAQASGEPQSLPGPMKFRGRAEAEEAELFMPPPPGETSLPGSSRSPSESVSISTD